MRHPGRKLLAGQLGPGQAPACLADRARTSYLMLPGVRAGTELASAARNDSDSPSALTELS